MRLDKELHAHAYCSKEQESTVFGMYVVCCYIITELSLSGDKIKILEPICNIQLTDYAL